MFLDAIPAEARQYHTCSCCRKFMTTFGALATVDARPSLIIFTAMLLAASAFRRGSTSAVVAASLRHQRSTTCPRFLSSVSPSNGGDDDDKQNHSNHEDGVADAHAAQLEDAIVATIDIDRADGGVDDAAQSSGAPTDDVPPITSDTTTATTTTTNNTATTSDQPGWLNSINLRPTEVVHELNRHIVGQSAAKRAVAIAMRNRWRRRQLPDELRKEITPRNVLLVGPTGYVFLLCQMFVCCCC